MTILEFPNTTSALGGAEWVRYNQRSAWIKLPGVPTPVRLPRCKLPAPDKWTAFSLADAAQEVRS